MTRKDNVVSKLEKKISIELSSEKLIYLLFKSLIVRLNTHTVLYCSTDQQNDYYITIHLTLSTYSIYQIVHGTKGDMAIYGPGCHPQIIIWTECFGPYTILWVTDRSIRQKTSSDKIREKTFY